MIQRIPYYIVTCYYLSPDPNCSPLWLEAVLQPIAPMTQGEALIHVARPSLRLSFPAFPNPSWTLSRGLCCCLPLTQQRYPKTIVEGKCSRARLEMRQGTFWNLLLFVWRSAASCAILLNISVFQSDYIQLMYNVLFASSHCSNKSSTSPLAFASK